jgi:SagB-type dehydrogenase family enzyme
VNLPSPNLKGETSLEEVLYERRSVREFSGDPLALAEVSQLLWSAQGITAGWGGRTAPSAGATYPLELYLVAGLVDGLPSGVYRYSPENHSLVRTREGDVRAALRTAALDQDWVKEAPASVIIAAAYERTTGKYGDRGVTYVHMEAGHAAQNLCLQAGSVDLGAVTVGAFDDEQVSDVVGLLTGESPLYVIPVGRKRS